MTAADALSLDETAQRVKLSADRFRKVWPQWVRELGFPAPFRAPVFVQVGGIRRRAGGNYAWRESSVDAWKAAREGALGKGRAAPAVNDNPPPVRRADPRLAQERAELRRLMREA